MTTPADRYGLPLSTASPDARDRYVDAVDRLLAAQPGAEDAFARALDGDPGFALAAIGRARCLALAGRGAEARAAAVLARTLAERASRREQQHVDALALAIEGQPATALAASLAHLAEFPRDAMVLAPATGVFGLYGFSGRADRETALLVLLDTLAPAYGDDWWFLAAHAFAACEAGQPDVARGRVERALAGNGANAHAAHVFAHTCYETGDDEAGMRFLDAWLPAYPRAGALHCHLAWHVALFAVAHGDLDGAARVHADAIAPGAAWGPPINVLTDGAALLWRAELAGGPRDGAAWRVLRDWARAAFPRPGVAFADVHVALACAGAGDATALAALVAALRGAERAGRQPAGPVVAALAGAFAAFARGDFGGTIDALAPVLDDHVRIGGSRAQRDLVEHTLLAAYLRAGRRDEVEALLARRPARCALVPVAGL